jgi:glycosyltransferase involved in cell wall biosynthesis
VLTVHDLNFLHEQTNPEVVAREIKKYQKRIDRTDHIVAISEFTKKDILSYLDIKNKPVTTIYNGCTILEYDDFNFTNYKPEVPFIFTMGKLGYKKNFHVLPALLVGNDYELIIAGIKSDYIDKIKAEAKKHNVENRVKVLGVVSDKERSWYLKNCLALAFPSLAEGFGLPVIEAMYFGKPVFLSALTSLPEVGGKEAYFFENFDAEYMKDVFEKGMTDYLSNNDKPNLLKQHALSFNWDSCAKQYYQVYQSLL